MKRICHLILLILLLISINSCNNEDDILGNRENLYKSKKNTYYFYVTFGTMPSLYASLHALSHDNPTYFSCERINTFDINLFPSNITFLYGDNYPNQISARDIMKNRIVEINRMEPNSVFEFFVDDLRARLGYDWFVAQGIDSSKVKVTLLSDGTATYNNFFNYFYNSIQGNAKWDDVASEINNLRWNSVDKLITPKLAEYESHDWPYYMSTLPTYTYYMQDKSLLETQSPYVKEQINKMNVNNISPLNLLNALSPEKQNVFYELTKFDKQKYSDLFDKSPKKNLIIIGTINSSTQKIYIDQVYNKYSAEYDIFYKPHPADTDYSNYETTYPNLTLLPAQMPFEIFVWSLIDKIDVIGGNQSTVFMTVPTSKVKFIFAENANSLPKPLNLVFQNANVEWIQ